MNEFRYLCPKCGQAFHEDQSVSECPQCKVPLLRALPVGRSIDFRTIDLRGLPAEIDVAQLLGHTLAEQEADEEMNAALRRVLAREYPQGHEGLYTLLDQELLAVERLRACTRLEAAQELAGSVSKLKIDPASGLPQMSVIRLEGNLEELPPEQQEEVREQIAEAVRSGRPLRRMQVTLRFAGSSGTRWLGALLILAALAVLVVLAWLRHR